MYGVAYKIPEDKCDEVLEHLDEREKCGYDKVTVTFYVEDDKTKMDINIYVGLESNDFYVGEEDIIKTAEVIATSEGESGKNVDYLYNLVESLQTICGAVDEYLRELWNLVRSLENL